MNTPLITSADPVWLRMTVKQALEDAIQELPESVVFEYARAGDYCPKCPDCGVTTIQASIRGGSLDGHYDGCMAQSRVDRRAALASLLSTL